MAGKCAYESPEMTELLGETLRPGGFELTEAGISLCGWRPGSALLDVGCGRGATVRYLNDTWGFRARGIDPSEKLIQLARKNGQPEEFSLGSGEAIPFDNESFEGILSECTLSLMENLDKTLKEVGRVLKKNGAFLITDVYARNPDGIGALKNDEFKSCMRGLYSLKQIKDNLDQNGFLLERCEDHSQLLKALLVKTVFEHGSMNAFWKKAGGPCAASFQERLKECRPGYYMIIARKAE